MITADPNTLRYGAHRFAVAAQEMKRQAIQLEQATSIARQGQDGWTGDGSQAFVLRGERLVHDANKASQAFESVANTMIRFAMRMERVLDLRRRADQLDQQAFEYGDETLDSIHTRQHLRHQAAQLRHQADSEASVADSQAAKEFQVIAQMVPATLIPGADANADLLEGLPKHWQDYYRRHPELLQEEKGAPTLTMGSYKQTDELATQRYLSQKPDDDRSFTDKLQDHVAGGVDAGTELIYELLYSVAHPIETVENIAYAVMHPDLVVQQLIKAKDDIISDWNRGNTYGWSKAVYKLALSVLGVKGVGLSEEAAASVTNAVSRIEFYNNLLAPAHKVVLPDGTVLRVSERVIQSNEELLTYFEGMGKGAGVNETILKNIDDFINGNREFNEVIEDYAKIYKGHVDSNKPWSWDDSIPGGDSLSSAQKRKIKEMAVTKGHIPEIEVTKVEGMRYGFADFAGAGVVEETVQLPEKFWKLSDKEQFKWLDERIGGTRKGMTWHHTEVPGKMELVPFGIHNITPHNGGRTAGMWADAPR